MILKNCIILKSILFCFNTSAYLMLLSMVAYQPVLRKTTPTVGPYVARTGHASHRRVSCLPLVSVVCP